MPSSTSSSEVLARLALIAAGVFVLVALADLPAPWILAGGLDDRGAYDRQGDLIRSLVFRRIRELQQMPELALVRGYYAYRAVPEEKPLEEIRVVLLGNSTGLFAVAPERLEQRLARELPGRRVRVVSLMFPFARVEDEAVLAEAALAKRPDVVVFTPNLKALEGANPLSARVRELFGGAGEGTREAEGAAFLVRRLRRHWVTYRERKALRGALLSAFASRRPGARAEARQLEQALDAVAEAADTGHVARLVETYEAHQLLGLVRERTEGRVAEKSPAWRRASATADRVQRAGVVGVAVFLPVHPLFRDARATAGFEWLHLDDRYARQFAGRSMDLYRRAGFVTESYLDALPASAFIDGVHLNGRGMRSISDRLADLLAKVLADVGG